MWCVAHTATLLPTCRSWSLAWVTENRLLFFRWSKRPERQKLCLFSVPSQRDRKRISTSLHAGLFDEHKHLKSLLLANAWHLRLIYKWWIFAGCPRSHPLGQHKLRVFYWKISIANMFSPSLFSSPLVSGWLVLCSDKLRVWILLLCKKKEKKKIEKCDKWPCMQPLHEVSGDLRTDTSKSLFLFTYTCACRQAHMYTYKNTGQK